MDSLKFSQLELKNKEDVKALQKELNQNGANLKVDGIFGPKTQAAYEERYGKANTGGYAYSIGQQMESLEPLFSVGRLNYTPRSLDSIRAQYEAGLRPQVDLAILEQTERTKAHKAELDADSLSRGMGRSTFVTDMKKRLMDKESREISRLESEYAAMIAKLIMETAEKELSRSFEAEQFNLNLQSQARLRAFSAAQSAYSANEKKAPKNKRSTVTPTSAENCHLFLAGLSPKERRTIYNGETAQGKRYRSELIESLGKSGYVAIQGIYPGS
ncbi:MAG TPA: peptidoglycan-binding domain-containing protein [Clostridia bacterium]|nr:peptidoglycan-binding domain-containing protein [Clostridia bacterium]